MPKSTKVAKATKALQGSDQLPGKERGLYRDAMVRVRIVVQSSCRWLERNLKSVLSCTHHIADLQKLWEQKNYKKALKNLDAILVKFPDHGGACRCFLLRPRASFAAAS